MIPYSKKKGIDLHVKSIQKQGFVHKPRRIRDIYRDSEIVDGKAVVVNGLDVNVTDAPILLDKISVLDIAKYVKLCREKKNTICACNKENMLGFSHNAIGQYNGVKRINLSTQSTVNTNEKCGCPTLSKFLSECGYNIRDIMRKESRWATQGRTHIHIINGKYRVDSSACIKYCYRCKIGVGTILSTQDERKRVVNTALCYIEQSVIDKVTEDDYSPLNQYQYLSSITPDIQKEILIRRRRNNKPILFPTDKQLNDPKCKERIELGKKVKGTDILDLNTLYDDNAFAYELIAEAQTTEVIEMYGLNKNVITDLICECFNEGECFNEDYVIAKLKIPYTFRGKTYNVVKDVTSVIDNVKENLELFGMVGEQELKDMGFEWSDIHTEVATKMIDGDFNESMLAKIFKCDVKYNDDTYLYKDVFDATSVIDEVKENLGLYGELGASIAEIGIEWTKEQYTIADAMIAGDFDNLQLNDVFNKTTTYDGKIYEVADTTPPTWLLEYCDKYGENIESIIRQYHLPYIAKHERAHHPCLCPLCFGICDYTTIDPPLLNQDEIPAKPAVWYIAGLLDELKLLNLLDSPADNGEYAKYTERIRNSWITRTVSRGIPLFTTYSKELDNQLDLKMICSRYNAILIPQIGLDLPQPLMNMFLGLHATNYLSSLTNLSEVGILYSLFDTILPEQCDRLHIPEKWEIQNEFGLSNLNNITSHNVQVYINVGMFARYEQLIMEQVIKNKTVILVQPKTDNTMFGGELLWQKSSNTLLTNTCEAPYLCGQLSTIADYDIIKYSDKQIFVTKIMDSDGVVTLQLCLRKEETDLYVRDVEYYTDTSIKIPTIYYCKIEKKLKVDRQTMHVDMNVLRLIQIRCLDSSQNYKSLCEYACAILAMTWAEKGKMDQRYYVDPLQMKNYVNIGIILSHRLHLMVQTLNHNAELNPFKYIMSRVNEEFSLLIREWLENTLHEKIESNGLIRDMLDDPIWSTIPGTTISKRIIKVIDYVENVIEVRKYYCTHHNECTLPLTSIECKCCGYQTASKSGKFCVCCTREDWHLFEPIVSDKKGKIIKTPKEIKTKRKEDEVEKPSKQTIPKEERVIKPYVATDLENVLLVLGANDAINWLNDVEIGTTRTTNYTIMIPYCMNGILWPTRKWCKILDLMPMRQEEPLSCGYDSLKNIFGDKMITLETMKTLTARDDMFTEQDLIRVCELIGENILLVTENATSIIKFNDTDRFGIIMHNPIALHWNPVNIEMQSHPLNVPYFFKQMFYDNNIANQNTSVERLRRHEKAKTLKRFTKILMAELLLEGKNLKLSNKTIYNGSEHQPNFGLYNFQVNKLINMEILHYYFDEKAEKYNDFIQHYQYDRSKLTDDVSVDWRNNMLVDVVTRKYKITRGTLGTENMENVTRKIRLRISKNADRRTVIMTDNKLKTGDRMMIQLPHKLQTVLINKLGKTIFLPIDLEVGYYDVYIFNDSLASLNKRLFAICVSNSDAIKALTLLKRSTCITGPPGSGKTYKILEQCKSNDLILTMTTPAKMRIKSSNPRCPVMTVERAMTIRATSQTLFIDEATMINWEQLMLLNIEQTQRIVAVGDIHQIGFKDMSTTGGVRILDNIMDYITQREQLTVVRRIGNPLFNTLPALFTGMTCECTHHTDLLIHPIAHDYIGQIKQLVEANRIDVVLCFYQSDKYSLRNINCDVETVHSFQGNESNRVLVLHRNTNDTDDGIHNHYDYVVSALTRAKLLTVWVTSSLDYVRDLNSYIKSIKTAGGALFMAELIKTDIAKHGKDAKYYKFIEMARTNPTEFGDMFMSNKITDYTINVTGNDVQICITKPKKFDILVTENGIMINDIFVARLASRYLSVFEQKYLDIVCDEKKISSTDVMLKTDAIYSLRGLSWLSKIHACMGLKLVLNNVEITTYDGCAYNCYVIFKHKNCELVIEKGISLSSMRKLNMDTTGNDENILQLLNSLGIIDHKGSYKLDYDYTLIGFAVTVERLKAILDGIYNWIMTKGQKDFYAMYKERNIKHIKTMEMIANHKYNGVIYGETNMAMFPLLINGDTYQLNEIVYCDKKTENTVFRCKEIMLELCIQKFVDNEFVQLALFVKSLFVRGRQGTYGMPTLKMDANLSQISDTALTMVTKRLDSLKISLMNQMNSHMPDLLLCHKRWCEPEFLKDAAQLVIPTKMATYNNGYEELIETLTMLRLRMYNMQNIVTYGSGHRGLPVRMNLLNVNCVTLPIKNKTYMDDILKSSQEHIEEIKQIKSIIEHVEDDDFKTKLTKRLEKPIGKPTILYVGTWLVDLTIPNIHDYLTKYTQIVGLIPQKDIEKYSDLVIITGDKLLYRDSPIVHIMSDWVTDFKNGKRYFTNIRMTVINVIQGIAIVIIYNEIEKENYSIITDYDTTGCDKYLVPDFDTPDTMQIVTIDWNLLNRILRRMVIPTMTVEDAIKMVQSTMMLRSYSSEGIILKSKIEIKRALYHVLIAATMTSESKMHILPLKMYTSNVLTKTIATESIKDITIGKIFDMFKKLVEKESPLTDNKNVREIIDSILIRFRRVVIHRRFVKFIKGSSGETKRVDDDNDDDNNDEDSDQPELQEKQPEYEEAHETIEEESKQLIKQTAPPYVVEKFPITVRKHALVVSLGSRGDVEPLYKVCEHLAKHDYEITVCTQKKLLDYILFDCNKIKVDGDASEHTRFAVCPTEAVKQGKINLFIETLRNAYMQSVTRCSRVDIVVSTPITVVAKYVAGHFKCPLLDCVMFPTLNDKTSGLILRAFNLVIKMYSNFAITGLPDLKPTTVKTFTMYCFSSYLCPIKHGIHVGRLRLSRNIGEKVDGQKGVLINFGSMPLKANELEGIIETFKEYKLFINKGWLLEIPTDKEITVLDEFNHDAWLHTFKIVIHHGGSGTTHACTKAGVHQVIHPQFGDQYMWCNKVMSLGLGQRYETGMKIRINEKALDDARLTLTKEEHLLEMHIIKFLKIKMNVQWAELYGITTLSTTENMTMGRFIVTGKSTEVYNPKVTKNCVYDCLNIAGFSKDDITTFKMLCGISGDPTLDQMERLLFATGHNYCIETKENMQLVVINKKLKVINIKITTHEQTLHAVLVAIQIHKIEPITMVQDKTLTMHNNFDWFNTGTSHNVDLIKMVHVIEKLLNNTNNLVDDVIIDKIGKYDKNDFYIKLRFKQLKETMSQLKHKLISFTGIAGEKHIHCSGSCPTINTILIVATDKGLQPAVSFSKPVGWGIVIREGTLLCSVAINTGRKLFTPKFLITRQIEVTPETTCINESTVQYMKARTGGLRSLTIRMRNARKLIIADYDNRSHHYQDLSQFIKMWQQENKLIEFVGDYTDEQTHWVLDKDQPIRWCLSNGKLNLRLEMARETNFKIKLESKEYNISISGSTLNIRPKEPLRETKDGMRDILGNVLTGVDENKVKPVIERTGIETINHVDDAKPLLTMYHKSRANDLYETMRGTTFVPDDCDDVTFDYDLMLTNGYSIVGRCIMLWTTSLTYKWFRHGGISVMREKLTLEDYGSKPPYEQKASREASVRMDALNALTVREHMLNNDEIEHTCNEVTTNHMCIEFETEGYDEITDKRIVKPSRVFYWSYLDLADKIYVEEIKNRKKITSTEEPGKLITVKKATFARYPELATPTFVTRAYEETNVTIVRVINSATLQTIKMDTWVEYQGILEVFMARKEVGEKLIFSYEETMKWLVGRKNSDRIIKELEKLLQQGTLYRDTKALKYHLKVESLLKEPIPSSALTTNTRQIMWQMKAICALYSPIFIEVKQRFKRWLKDKVIYTDGLRYDELNTLCNAYQVNDPWMFDDDLSKQDRQTTHDLLSIEMMMYETLGVDQDVLTMWKQVHNHWNFRGKYVKGNLDAMRLTGQATTSLGNAIVNLITHWRFIKENYNKWVFTLICGDDHLTIFEGKPSIEKFKTTLRVRYNMISKPKLSRIGDFISLLVTTLENRVHLVPNIMRIKNKYEVTNGLGDLDEEKLLLRTLSYCCILGNIKQVKEYLKEKEITLEPTKWYDFNKMIEINSEQHKISREDVLTLLNSIMEMFKEQPIIHEFRMFMGY